MRAETVLCEVVDALGVCLCEAVLRAGGDGARVDGGHGRALRGVPGLGEGPAGGFDLVVGASGAYEGVGLAAEAVGGGGVGGAAEGAPAG